MTRIQAENARRPEGHGKEGRCRGMKEGWYDKREKGKREGRYVRRQPAIIAVDERVTCEVCFRRKYLNHQLYFRKNGSFRKMCVFLHQPVKHTINQNHKV